MWIWHVEDKRSNFVSRICFSAFTLIRKASFKKDEFCFPSVKNHKSSLFLLLFYGFTEKIVFNAIVY